MNGYHHGATGYVAGPGSTWMSPTFPAAGNKKTYVHLAGL